MHYVNTLLICRDRLSILLSWKFDQLCFCWFHESFIHLVPLPHWLFSLQHVSWSFYNLLCQPSTFQIAFQIVKDCKIKKSLIPNVILRTIILNLSIHYWPTCLWNSFSLFHLLKTHNCEHHYIWHASSLKLLSGKQ